ncbi:D-amino acid aminotransferase [Pseudazoarcus pumilus]|uniref:D-amino acid aminotransferase n=1 Tax=Pseudazoarcus pumilus TaxID=2067960 RepID=A0A2I6SA92_9RHOO|nr:D-amino acid aminotransferase [Pseudazoarcus pumilus]AUN96169.1 D-amino acid aminotransferase [Pseudazoarcus pumilus]
MSICYLNGGFVPRSEARISPMDRGFLFGDGVYEVIPVYGGRAFRLDAHLARLQRSLAGIGIANPHSHAEWTDLVQRLVAAHHWPAQAVYVQVTRGADTVRNHAFPHDLPPTVFMTADALAPIAPEQLERGVSAVSAADNRWLRCDLKTTALLANCLLRQLAVEQGCAETVLFRDGFLTEGSASNIFVVRDGVLLAPPKSHLMLPGITCDVVLELAAKHGQATEVREIREEEVHSADELWLTSSTKEVLPITRLDDKPVGSGRPGPVTRAMIDWFRQARIEECGA